MITVAVRAVFSSKLMQEVVKAKEETFKIWRTYGRYEVDKELYSDHRNQQSLSLLEHIA